MGRLILVGHSFGGFVTRMLADRRQGSMLGLILVDTSHEDQLQRLEANGRKNMMPRGNSFVVSPAEIPVSLPVPIQRKIRAFSRMRKTYAALHAEMRYFRESAEQVRRSRHALEFPVLVLMRGKDLYANDAGGDEKTAIWEELQQDLTTLSKQGQLVIARQSGHHVHADEPTVVIDAIDTLLDDHEARVAESR